MASIRLLLQIAVQYDLLIHRMHVKSAYLNAPLDYEIFVELPEGFEGKNENYVCKHKKSLYWLKQNLEQNKISSNHLTTPACTFKMSTIKYPSFYCGFMIY